MTMYEKRLAAAAAHEGNRNAFLDGWDTMSRNGALFAGMRKYPTNKDERSFILGFHACDDALSEPKV